MKKIIFFSLFILLGCVANAQTSTTREVTKDSFSLVLKTDPRTNTQVWYENRTITYNTGEIEFGSRFVGNNPVAPIPAADTAQVVAIYAGMQESLSNTLVSAARVLVFQNVQVAKMIENNRAVTAAGLPSVFSYVAAANKFKFVDSTGVSAPYRFQVNADPWINATLEYNAQGALFLKWGASNSKQVFVAGNGHLVVTNYPTTGKDLHLYEVEPRWYVSQDRSVKLVRND